MSATVSTHTLSGLDGTHAGGVRVTLTRITGTPETAVQRRYRRGRAAESAG
jgi:5-hydroxyisourate hydrolase-like protein (transthyretin family)